MDLLYLTVTTILTLLLLKRAAHGLDVIPDRCLNCLAKLGSDNRNKCVLHGEVAVTHSEKNNWLCGEYKISPDYFTDCTVRFNVTAFWPELTDHRNCTKDYNCSRQCVNGYMKKYSHSCKRGETPTCADYLRLHAAGPNGCLETKEKDSKVLLEHATARCGCMATYEDEKYCQSINGTTEFLATVIAVPIVSFTVLVTVVVITVMCCDLARRLRLNVTTTYTAGQFNNWEKSLDNKHSKPQKQSDFDEEISPSLRRYVSPELTQTSSTERLPLPTFTARDGSVSTLDLRDVVVSPKPKPHLKERAVYEPALPYNSDEDETPGSDQGVYAQKVTVKNLHDYIYFDHLENIKEPTVMCENCVFDDDEGSSSPKPSSHLGPSVPRAPIQIPRSATPKLYQK